MRGEVGQIIQSPITLAEKVSRLKQIEKAEYQPLMKQLAYTKEAEELKALVKLLKDLGDLTRHIGDYSIEPHSEEVPPIA